MIQLYRNDTALPFHLQLSEISAVVQAAPGDTYRGVKPLLTIFLKNLYMFK